MSIGLPRLPKVGPTLARAIVAWREAHGPFGGLSGLDAVPGIGPGMLQGLAAHATFSGTPHPRDSTAQSGTRAAAGAPLDLNTATAADLDRLPGIGPAKAQSIVAYREKEGPFRSGADLAGIPGIGPALAARLQNLAVVR